MSFYELDFNEFAISQYSLIGIHTTLNDYKLAYLLNSKLECFFEKANFCLDIKNKNKEIVSFPIYEYVNEKEDTNWFLINNVSKKKVEIEAIGLFMKRTTSVVEYLVSEKKKVDYFLKIEGDFKETFVDSLINNIKTIPQVVTSYQIDIDTLKSKDFLIF
ncbi:IPExxxVDY family protein [Tenacibaculum sp. 190524A02b]|uniref:IPExxxVDY family protein n=1 Tax=Tenacibaculum vairaonense TaxID=3137860 RepID=A0ABM9PQK9_9FLAO